MRTLVLHANNSSSNLGVRVLAEGASLMACKLGATHVDHYHFGDPGPSVAPTTKTLSRELLVPGAITQWLSEYELILDTGGGDSFAGIYGARRLYQIGVLRQLAVRAGCHVLLTPQTIGPFLGDKQTRFARWSVRGTLGVMCRDPRSLTEARSMVDDIPVYESSDLVFLLGQPDQVEGSSDRVILNASGLLWLSNNHIEASTYRDLVIDICRRIKATGRPVHVMAHVLNGTTTDDDQIAADHLDNLGVVDKILMPGGLKDARAELSSAHLVIASRMHASLNSLSVATATVPLAYSRKFRPLFEDLGWNYVVDLRATSAAEVVKTGDNAARSLEMLEAAHSVGVGKVAQSISRAGDSLL